MNTFIKPKEEKVRGMRTPVLVAAVAALHGIAFGAFLFMQGCGTTAVGPETTPVVEHPPAPVIPPKGSPAVTPEAPAPKPSFATKPVVPAVAPPLATPDLAAGRTVTVQKGDSLSMVGYRYDVSWREIAELNAIRPPYALREGQKLLLPAHARPQPRAAKAATPKATAPKAATGSAPAAAPAPGEYTVQPGDVLSKIAARNGVTTKAIKEANGLKSDMIRVGQKLKIPGKAEAAPAAPAPAPAEPPAPAPAVPPVEAAPVAPPPAAPGGSTLAPIPAAPPPAPAPGGDMMFTYTLKESETLDDVARNFAVPKQDIMSFNNIADEKTIKAGDKIKIPSPQ